MLQAYDLQTAQYMSKQAACSPSDPETGTPGVQGGHDLLVALWRGLTRAEQPLPAAAMKALGLLHSYLLLRPLTALGEHEVPSR